MLTIYGCKKKTLTVFLAALFAITAPIALSAKEKATPENTFVIVTLADGTRIEGYVVTPLQDYARPFVSKVGIAREFGGDAYEYTSDEVVSIVFPPSESDTSTVVYHSVWAEKQARNLWNKTPQLHKSPVFLRLIYDGSRVKGYVMPIMDVTHAGTMNTVEYTWRYYYKCFDSDTAHIYWDDIRGIIPNMKKVMKFYFHQFPMLCQAVDNKTITAGDFRDNPAIVLPIMDLTYGDSVQLQSAPAPIDTIEPKHSDNQRATYSAPDTVKSTRIPTVNGTSTSQDAKRKRVFTENAFPRYRQIINVGVSPDVAPWSRRFVHASSTDYKVIVPPIAISYDVCWWDFNRAGSIGTAYSLAYSRFGYDWTWNDGYRDVVYNTRCNRFDVQAGFTYHITICRNFEAYARAMVDIAVITDHTFDSDTGDKSIADSEFHAHVSFAGVAGLRYYFCPAVGIYVEGGYDIGYLSAGFTFPL